MHGKKLQANEEDSFFNKFIFCFSDFDQGQSEDFFSISAIKYHQHAPSSGMGLWRNKVDGKDFSSKLFFQPCLEVDVKTQNSIRSTNTFVKIYFFGPNKNLLATVFKSSVAVHGPKSVYDFPVFFTQNNPEALFFEMPSKILDDDWTAIAVFGDKHEVTVKTYPDRSPANFDFPEKNIFENKSIDPIERKIAIDPLVEYVMETKNQEQPRLTLFLRPPIGMADASQARGVLAICLLADRSKN